jgi:transposase-like protein
MYLNNVGIRKCALFIGCSPQTIANWVANAAKILKGWIDERNALKEETPDIIELDEIYTFVQKKGGKRSYGLLILEMQNVLLRIQ